MARGESETASQLARQHERARHAEHVAHREQPDDDEEAPVGPGQHAREIHRGHLVAQEPVGDDGQGHHQKRALQDVPAVSCAQERADERCRQKIERRPGRMLASASARSSGDERRPGRAGASVTTIAGMRNTSDPGTHITTPAMT